MNTPHTPLIVQPNTGKDLHAFGNVLSVLLSGEQTGGKFALMSEWAPPGGGPPLHCHDNEDEVFMVAEGRISYFVGGEWTEVGVGGVIHLPRGTAHCYRNIGTTPCRHWILTFPSGFEKFFESCANEYAKSDNPEQERIIQIHREHGIALLEAGKH